MRKKNRLLRRMEARNLIRYGNIKVNCVRGSKMESSEHFLTKAVICKLLMDKGEEFITEASFEVSLGMRDDCKRADIFVTDTLSVVEIYHTETQRSIESKRAYYAKKNLNFYAIKAGASMEEIYDLVGCL